MTQEDTDHYDHLCSRPDAVDARNQLHVALDVRLWIHTVRLVGVIRAQVDDDDISWRNLAEIVWDRVVFT